MDDQAARQEAQGHDAVLGGRARSPLKSESRPPDTIESDEANHSAAKVSGMKIGITCYPTYGGSGVVATELGLELAQRGHEIHFISYAQPIRLTGPHPNIHYHEVEVSRYPLFDYPPYDLALATRMAEVSELYALDLLHVHYAIPHSVSALLARQMLAASRRGQKLPFVTTLHGTDITLVGQDRSYLPITRFSIEQSDGVTAISQYLRESTLREFDVKNNIQVIYNFVNCDVYVRDAGAAQRRLEYAPNGERILVHLSNFRPVKRITDTMEIFDRVRKQIPSQTAFDWRWSRPLRRNGLPCKRAFIMTFFFWVSRTRSMKSWPSPMSFCCPANLNRLDWQLSKGWRAK